MRRLSLAFVLLLTGTKAAMLRNGADDCDSALASRRMSSCQVEVPSPDNSTRSRLATMLRRLRPVPWSDFLPL